MAAKRNFEFAIDEFYHVFNHGNGDRLTFLDDKDKRHFTHLLFLTNGSNTFEFSDLNLASIYQFNRGETLVDIGAWCLMDNHYHFLFKERIEGGIMKFVQRLVASYTMYFNARHKKRGSIFEGPFKAKPVEFDEYLRHLFAYIHLNPAKMVKPDWKGGKLVGDQKVWDHLNTYQFSSYHDYLGKDRSEKVTLNKAAFPEYFNNPKEVEEDMLDWLNFGDWE